uniref:Hypothetical lipoprotein transmembrane n=1 Tax=Spiroplasma citri TaxID=2133 RepID=Q14LH6_SPICI|nr:hypothetical lipoprotein transmembrane [Spiroplasma citri]
MKKWLSIIGAIGLTATSTTTLISCKKENNKNTKTIAIAPTTKAQQPPEGSNWKQVIAQNKPFNTVDNKWYFVVWRGEKTNDWKIIKFNNKKDIILDIDNDFNIKLGKTELFINGYSSGNDLCLQTRPGSAISIASFQKDNGTYFKSIYRWDGVGEPEIPIINKNTGEITDWKEQKGTS